MGDLDGLSREFAREHSGRLWKQLFRGDDEPARASGGWVEPLVFAVAAAVAIQVARLVADFPDEEPNWLFRNGSLFVLPFLAGYFARRRELDARGWAPTAAPFLLAALVVNLRAGLVDDYQLFVVPVVVGAGKQALLRDGRIDLELVDERRFRNDTVFLHYRTRT